MISNKLPQGPITPKQYNTELYDEWNRARGFVAGLNHAMQKTDDYEGAIWGGNRQNQSFHENWFTPFSGPQIDETQEKNFFVIIHYVGADGNEYTAFKKIHDTEHFCAYGVKKVDSK